MYHFDRLVGRYRCDGQRGVVLCCGSDPQDQHWAEQMLQLLTVDPHSPAEFRANIVRNLDEFHEAFGTGPGDGLWLDPEARVRIW